MAYGTREVYPFLGQHQSSLDHLVYCHGTIAGITREVHENGNVRYRKKTAVGTPGVWIAEEKAYSTLYKIDELQYLLQSKEGKASIIFRMLRKRNL